MAGTVRLSDIQTSNLDFERKQHLANWLIKSSPHMPNPVATITTTGIPPHHHTTVKSPIYFWGQPGHMSLTSSKSPIFTSQTNLPLQIITTQEGQKPKLRRFNSHDTSANMFSVADFENARQASKQRQNPPAVKSNSLGGDGSTEDSENSKFGSDSSRDIMPIERFLHRNFLPKVARLITRESSNECTLDIYDVKNSQHNLPKLQSLQDLSHLDSLLNIQPQKAGELMLIYKQIRNRKLYHAISTKSMDWKKGIKIPQEYPGYFSLLNEKGGATASIYTTIIQLVRERVYKFLSMENMVAYSESQNQDIAIKSHYVKTTAKAGQVFRLLAVFEDGRSQHQNKSGPLSDFSSSSDREKVRGRYAQLLCENRQMLYVSLATKGKFYEVEMNSHSQKGKQQQKNGQINPEYVHRIGDITQNSPLPLNVRLISGTLPGISTDCITIHKISMEDVVISCPIDERDSRSSLVLRTISILPDMKLQKCLLGYDNEKKLLASPNIQNILKYCKFNYESHTQAVEAEQLTDQPEKKMRKLKSEGFKLLRPINLTKLLHREKSYVAHEKEDSIIFLTKAELQRLETQQQQKQVTKPPERSLSSKLKVFEPSKRKWFAERKSAKNKTSSFSSFDVSLEGNRQSIDRYSDMNKMIQARFGSECDIASSQFGRESRALSDIGYDIRCSAPRIDKSMSLENMKFHSSATMLATTVISPTPDLVKVDKSNIIGSADRLSHQEVLPTPGKSQQSFISKKLYSEFHVKTKNHSKSSSNLNQLWHQLGLPQKSSKHHKSKRSQELRRSNLKLADEYSSVQDSIVSLDDNASSIYDSKTCMENIYAEICVHNVAPEEIGGHSQTHTTNL
uniref:CABIT domain-containing protein n=1 Tax=Phlebotomus kandelakii TaxID=1109342 RepID=A0A6B2ED67_9DIPT